MRQSWMVAAVADELPEELDQLDPTESQDDSTLQKGEPKRGVIGAAQGPKEDIYGMQLRVAYQVRSL